MSRYNPELEQLRIFLSEDAQRIQDEGNSAFEDMDAEALAAFVAKKKAIPRIGKLLREGVELDRKIAFLGRSIPLLLVILIMAVGFSIANFYFPGALNTAMDYLLSNTWTLCVMGALIFVAVKHITKSINIFISAKKEEDYTPVGIAGGRSFAGKKALVTERYPRRYSLRSSRWCSNSVEEFMKYSKEVRSGWARNHGRNDPFTSATTWKSIPSHPEGCHLLDISGTISDKNMYKEINDKLLNIKKETGVEVLVYMFGDMQSRLPVELTKRLGHYYLENNTKYENGNFIIIMTSRSTGAVGMYAAPAVKHIIHPLWLRNTHKKLNTNTQWNTKMNPYISTLHDRLIAKKGIIFNNKLIVSVYDYWWALLLGAAVLIKGISFLYQYWSYWGERYCSVHGQYLLGDDNPKIVYEHLTDGQKAEVDSDCVTYAVWRCPSENCTTDKVDEVHWNYLRNDCLICLKCRHRTSQAARIISTRPDEDNFGEALNHRTCRFCKYEEAWLTMMPANYGGWKDPEHDKDLQGNYGSQWWIKFKMSILGHLLMGSSGPQGEVRRGGVGMLSNKDGVYSPPSH